MQILIVDDEPIISLGLIKMVQTYTPAFKGIRTAMNGHEALKLIAELTPDIVLTDIRMPKMDGLSLCQSIHEQYEHIQTIVISGYNDFEYAQKCMDYGVKHYLLKPVTKSDIHEVLDKLTRKMVRGYVSVSLYAEWVDRMEQSIWSLQMDELERLTGQWRTTVLSSGLTLAQTNELLQDCLVLLIKRFQTRRFSPYLAKTDVAASSVKEALDIFEFQLKQLATDLLAIRNGNFKDPMEEARAYIDSRLSQEISLDQVAMMVGLTPTYFSALFKKTTQVTFVHYRIHKRMEKAKELLAIPHIRIVDVALEVGYEDYPHFTKTFKKIVGVSPSEYRFGIGIR
ncbi:response regulator transcription factor [Paenibacillus radicis (ex Xue et al. 2023)]|uniref:Response regulator n=1 Tax=Paenibacillus radicis (ex Xue et al. 2023) TaxID=2972489 RepID=A0ABT1YPJ5_9BACL|nr:response regulator [Paenibacillus radicis (ex Xue et al. 2023)]MCR8635103.1 response regulator [Paenibacillus radicis (ex Xue et al. 2023)]